MKQRVEEMEAEAKKLREMQAAAEKSTESGASVASGEGLETEDDRQAADERSVYVGNVSLLSIMFLDSCLLTTSICLFFSLAQVDYGASPEDIQAHFQSCGTINRVTILCDKFTGHPKGYVSVKLSSCSFRTISFLLYPRLLTNFYSVTHMLNLRTQHSLKRLCR